MIAVTGATGFVGSHFIEALEERKIPFRLLLRKNSAREGEISKFGAKRFHVNFLDPESLRPALEGADILVHFLGLINGSEQQLQRVNIEMTRHLSQAAKEAGVKKIIYISSAAAVNPHGTYGKTKARGEEFVKTSGIPYLIFRPAYIYGNGDKNTTNMIPRKLKYWPVIPLLGGGSFKLQPVYIDDVIQLLIQGLYFSRINSTYTVAGPEQISLKEMLRILMRYLKVKRLLFPVPLKPVQWFFRTFYFIFKHSRIPVKQILELDKHEAFDISAARRDFQFDPMPFEDGVQTMFLG